MILDEHSVVKCCQVGGRLDFSILETGSGKNNIVNLPLTRWARGVHQRRVLSVHGGGAAIRVGPIVIAVEDLKFVLAEEEDAAVAPALAIAFRRIGCGKLDM